MSFIKEDFCPEKDEKIISPMSCYDKNNPFKILRQKNHSDQLADQKYNNVFSRNAVKTIFMFSEMRGRLLSREGGERSVLGKLILLAK